MQRHHREGYVIRTVLFWTATPLVGNVHREREGNCSMLKAYLDSAGVRWVSPYNLVKTVTIASDRCSGFPSERRIAQNIFDGSTEFLTF